jgi:hypothetical protein
LYFWRQTFGVEDDTFEKIVYAVVIPATPPTSLGTAVKDVPTSQLDKIWEGVKSVEQISDTIKSLDRRENAERRAGVADGSDRMRVSVGP